MANSKAEALNILSNDIRRCFSRVDLQFALHTTEKTTAERLSLIAKQFHLCAIDVKDAITPPIEKLINGDYVGFSDNAPRPWNIDAEKRRNKIIDMVSEATRFICK